MATLTLIKLGGSIITDKNTPYTAREDNICRLGQEIKQAQVDDPRIVITHGAGSFAHTSASRYGTANGLRDHDSIRGLCLVQQDAITLNRIVNRTLLDCGLNVMSFMPSSYTFANNKQLHSQFAAPILEALKHNIIPVIFGDVILDKTLGCCIFSGETSLDNLIPTFLANGFPELKIIQVGSTAGVYDGSGQTIPLITPQTVASIQSALVPNGVPDVTGGILHKVGMSLQMASNGIEVAIIDGTIPGNLKNALLGNAFIGTSIRHH